MTKKNNAGKLTLELSHHENPDINAGGYWTPNHGNGAPFTVEVADYAEASEKCLAFIAGHELGAGNWGGGKISQGGKVVAHVAYNGRVFPGAKWFSGIKALYPVDQAVR
jgi:hypothetical protein